MKRGVRCQHRMGSVFCTHPMLPHPGYAVSERCASCGEWLSLGPSNDSDTAVQIEIVAAMYADDDTITEPAARGWDMHRIDEDATPGSGSELAGWLARQIAKHDEEQS